nr:phosphopantetheine-binding protein [Acinetobacter sp. Marseille-Q1620]
MFYIFPKKIEFNPSQTKWSFQSISSLLLIVALDEIRLLPDYEKSALYEHIRQLIKKAKALEIPIIELKTSEPQNAMMLLGQYLSPESQLVMAGLVNPQFKQIMQYMRSVTDKICVVEDAILLPGPEQHIQWINTISQEHIHHINTYNLTRLWALSAPTHLIMSSKGILLAIAEQLDIDALEINPEVNLREYGLDSVAMVSLIGLWRANGANITYEDFLENNSLIKLFNFLKIT